MNKYIDGHQEIAEIGRGKNPEQRCVDVGVALDMFEKRHNLEHDERNRAEYIERYAPDSLSFEQKKLLHPEQYQD